MTRLLVPEAFGLMTLANVILIGLSMISDIGIKPSIVQNRRGHSIAFLNTAWTLQIVRGFSLWLLACALAYPAALLYGEKILFPLICTLGITAAINGFSTTALAVKEKQVAFGTLTIVQTIGSIATLLVTTMLALWLRSVWSLAGGAIAGATINVLIGYWFAPSHRHRLQIDPEALSALARFGRWILLSTLVTYLGGHGIRAFQGALLPISTFGVLSIAQTIAWMPGEFVSQIVGAVGFASLSEVSAKDGNTFNALRKIRAVSLGIAVPSFIFLALASHEIIGILYDSRYSQAGDYVSLIALAGAVAVLPIGYQNAFLAEGRSQLQFYIQSFLAVSRIAGMGIGFTLGGVYGLLVGDGLAILSLYPVVAVLAHKRRILDTTMDTLLLLAVIGSAGLIYWRDYHV
ncbi:oligosaccharide flippase family protein [Bradyrhizobium sp. INPA01-394B]|uniref:Oligosaccharide flippase family protein n=1 Tax=Bradyrhizobium campsiandrae TaxID=1729892 RepID=A0ABR7UAT4_9BRAD|nr:oligosaccharide flippase family protein [Bradyrhizobium campsiandrae]MBC9981034.1 oligosaccharide flippase family protein [Bradyrhizobium campsiandrae]